MKIKYKLVLISIFLIVLGGVIFFISNIIKYVILSSINNYFPTTKIVDFESKFNNFSLKLKDPNFVATVYGQFFPFTASVDGNINNLSMFNFLLNGKLKFNGEIIKNDSLIIKGNSFFAKGYLNFTCDLDNKKCKGEGKGFDTTMLLKMISLDIPYVMGKTNLKIDKNNIDLNTKGEFNNTTIYVPFTAKTNMTFNKNYILFSSIIDSKIGKIYITQGKFNNKAINFIYEAHDVNLFSFRKLFLYPLKGDVSLNGQYKNNVLKFRNKEIEGYKDNKLVINLKMDSTNFFNYINIKPLIKGEVSGNIQIDKRGVFSLLISNAYFLKNFFTQKLFKLTGIRIDNKLLNNIFLKGSFDNKKIDFSLVASNNDFYINFLNMEFFYPNKFESEIVLSNQNITYKIKIKNMDFKIIEKRIKKEKQEVLVF